jgi:transposase-like protein
MDQAEFQALSAQLGALSEAQREAIQTALAAKAGGADALALIDRRFGAAPVCGHCRATHFTRWGRSNGLVRYQCNACDRTFNALTGTPLAHLRRRDAWLAYAQAIVDRLPLRKAANRVGIALDTAFRWRHRFLERPQDMKPAKVEGVVEADETFVLKSQKGARGVVGRKPRKRGGKASKPGLSTDEHDCILVIRDRHAATTDALLPDLEGKTFATVLEPVVAKDAVLVTDGRAAYGQWAEAAGVLNIWLNASKGERSYGVYHLQNVNGYHARFKGWLAPFRGVASKYLASYLGWHRMKDREGVRLAAAGCLYAASGFG